MVSYLINCSSPINTHNENFGNNEFLIAREWTFNSIPENCNSGTTRSYIQFVEMNTIPANAIIQNAKLFLFGDPSSPNNAAPNEIEIGSIINSWDEQTITWSNMPIVDYSFGITHNSSTSSHQNISIDVTSIVADQFQNGTNYGFGIKLINEVIYSRWTWASSNNANPAIRPKLEIKYLIPCDANFTYSFNTETNEFIFTPNSTNGYQYDWDINGSIYTSIGPAPITTTFPTPGNYFICLQTDDSGKDKCKKCIILCVTEDQIVKPQSKGSKQNSKIQTKIINLYPNPASQSFSLDVFSGQDGIGKMIIYDLIGTKISEKLINLQKGNQTFEHSVTSISVSTRPSHIV